MGQHTESPRQDPLPQTCTWVKQALKRLPLLKPLSRLWAFPYNQKKEKGHCGSTLDKLRSPVTPYSVGTFGGFASFSSPLGKLYLLGKLFMVKRPCVLQGSWSISQFCHFIPRWALGSQCISELQFPFCKMMIIASSLIAYGIWMA